MKLEPVSKPPQDDHEAGNVEECLVDAQLAIVADGQVAEVSQPCVGSLHLPAFAVAAERASILGRRANAPGFVG